MVSDDYIAAALKALEEMGSSSSSPAELVSKWESFVEECEAGYSWDVSEYDNEIRARRQLDRLLEMESLKVFPALAELSEAVRTIDERFRALLQENVERPKKRFWYDRGVLRKAGFQYAQFFHSAFGIEVENSDS